MECAYCHKTISEDAIAPGDFFITCNHCNALNNRPMETSFPPSEQSPVIETAGPAEAPGRPSQAVRGEQAAPRRVRPPGTAEPVAHKPLPQRKGRLRLAWPWTKGFEQAFFLCLALFWFIYILGAFGPDRQIVIFLALMAVGYYPLAQALNKTVIEANKDDIMLFAEPLPWTGRMTFKTSDVTQIYCKMDPRRRSEGFSTFNVNAIFNSGKEIMLTAWLKTPEEARFIEQSIEEHLGIVDRAVAGEIEK